MTNKPSYKRITLNGTAVLIDQRSDPSWAPVVAVERFYNSNEQLTTVVNHLDFDKAVANYKYKT